MADIIGIHHVSLTVRDVERSAAWYAELLGLVPVDHGGQGGHTFAVLAHPASGLVIGLHAYADGPGGAFTEFRVGLDHLAFAVERRAELEEWRAELVRRGIDHSPIADTPNGSALVFRDDDRIQLEFFSPATT
ncbi:MAG: VOC family protein [Actinomycetota bacterium]|nr:VOC family protein [Actinomycetota bacterium]